MPAITAVAKKYNIATIIDNTWATPLFFRAHDMGCDLSLEAGTKYLGGHSDLLMGIVSANAEWWPKLRETYDLMAMLPGAEDCFLALRGLRTLSIRLKEAQSRALDIAHWLKARPEVIRVLHPAFEDCQDTRSGNATSPVLPVCSLWCWIRNLHRMTSADCWTAFPSSAWAIPGAVLKA